MRIQPERMRKIEIGTNHYPIIVLNKNGTRHSYSVHRLVAKAFLQNPGNLEQVNHINGIKTDNRVENLEWCTRSQNQKHAYKLGLFDPCKNFKNRERSKTVEQYDKDGEFIQEYSSMKEASKLTHVDASLISRCCSKATKSAGGFVWKIKET